MNQYVLKINSIAKPNKYTKWYCSIINSALSRPQNRQLLKESIGYVESHHILPKSFGLGGVKEKDNLVFLTAKEHFIVHLCATKMFDGAFKNKMIFAFRLLKSKNVHQMSRVNSRMYSIIKPDFQSFVRLYKGFEVKYLHIEHTDKIHELEQNGWSKIMSNEYRNYRMGSRMNGKKHSEETKAKMSEAQMGVPKPSLKGVKKSRESVLKMLKTKEKIKNDSPEKYRESIERGAKRRKEMYQSGELDVSGDKNPRFGVSLTNQTKQLIGEKNSQAWARKKENLELYQQHIEKIKDLSKKRWDNDDGSLRDRISITSSLAHQKYGVHPKEFYETRVKPLIYLGFLPAAIVRYKLIDTEKQNIKRWVKQFGSNEDMKKFEENKKMGAGTNRAYVQFQEDQYKKYFFHGPPDPKSS